MIKISKSVCLNLVNCFLVVVVLGLGTGPLQAAVYTDYPLAQSLISELVSEQGMNEQVLTSLIGQAVKKDRIIELMDSPAEAKPWKDYRNILVTPQRTKQGVEFLEKYGEALLRAESVFGVPAEIITAIIGVETRYGRVTGSFRVIDSLATLAFDYPRRSEFFLKELKHYIIFTDQEGIDPLSIKGSYAGAMGWGQFMPSSFRAYAIDFDGDGLKDIWNNPVDAIGSVANYFYRHGWQPDGEVVVRAEARSKEFKEFLAKGRSRLKPVRTISTWEELGIHSEQPLEQDALATAIELEGIEGLEYWLGLNNFYVITRYNISALYALAIYQLSQEITLTNEANE